MRQSSLSQHKSDKIRNQVSSICILTRSMRPAQLRCLWKEAVLSQCFLLQFFHLSVNSRGALSLQDHKSILPGREITFLWIITNKHKQWFVMKTQLFSNKIWNVWNRSAFFIFILVVFSQNKKYNNRQCLEDVCAPLGSQDFRFIPGLNSRRLSEVMSMWSKTRLKANACTSGAAQCCANSCLLKSWTFPSVHHSLKSFSADSVHGRAM